MRAIAAGQAGSRGGDGAGAAEDAAAAGGAGTAGLATATGGAETTRLAATAGVAAEQLAHLARVAQAVADTQARAVAEYAERAAATVAAGRKLLFCGNGGSAADAQHLAAECVVRLSRTRGALPALALTTDTSILTACANDLGYDEVFARQVDALGRPGDLLVLHSTSGNSPNLLRAAETARAREIATVGVLAGDGGRLRSMVDLAIVVGTADGARAQELHLAIGHVVCGHVERTAAA